MNRASRMQARVSHILGQERNSSGSAGTAVEENYGNTAAGPSSSARFKRGGIVEAVEGIKGKPRMDKLPRRSGGSCMPKRAMGGSVLADEEVLDGPQDIPARSSAPRKPMEAKPKAGTTVNIVLAPGAGQGAPAPMPAPVSGGPQLPPPRPPAPPMMAPPGMMPPGAPMPMRKHGGRVMAGGGSGLGRLNKIKDYGDKA